MVPPTMSFLLEELNLLLDSYLGSNLTQLSPHDVSHACTVTDTGSICTYTCRSLPLSLSFKPILPPTTTIYILSY